MSPRRPRRVLGYARLSRDTEESTSISRQRASILAACESRGWDLLDVEEDVDVSATKRRLDRPGLNRLRSRIASGEADTVLVWRLDRVARSVSDLSVLVEEWSASGAALVSATEPFDMSTPAGRAMLQLLGVFAELEAATIRERVRSSRAGLVAARRWPGGPAPFGYRTAPSPDGPGRVLVVDDDEARFLRMAAGMVLGGASLYAATKALNAAGSKPRRAAAWSLSSLRVVLLGDAALGRLTHGGEVVRDEHGLPVAPWPAILSVPDSEQLRALLAERRAAGPRKRASRLLSGLLRCSGCGGTLRLNSRGSSNGRRLTSYTCHGRTDGRACQAPVSVSADRIEEHVAGAFADHCGDREVVYTVREGDSSSATRLAELREAITATASALTVSGADVPALVGRLEALKEAEATEAAKAPTTTERVIRTGMTYGEVLGEIDEPGRLPEARAYLAEALAEPIVVLPGRRGARGLDPSRVRLRWRADSAA